MKHKWVIKTKSQRQAEAAGKPTPSPTVERMRMQETFGKSTAARIAGFEKALKLLQTNPDVYNKMSELEASTLAAKFTRCIDKLKSRLQEESYASTR